MKIDKKKYLRRLISVIVILVALAAGGLGHVFFAEHISRTQVQTVEVDPEGPLVGRSILASSFNAIQLVQKLVNAVQSKADVRDIYRSVPIHQLNGVSYETFSSYVDLIRKHAKFTVDTFSAMSTSARERIQKSMLQHMPQQRTLIENSQFFWLENSADPTTSGKIPFIVPKSIQGEPYLSKVWFERCIDLYEYSRFYFDILSRGKIQEVSRLLYSDSPDPAVRERKAELLIDYYRQHGVDFSQDLELYTLRMDEINFSVTLSREIADTDENAFLLLKREMGIVYNDAGDFIVEDDAYSGLDPADYKVFRGEYELFGIGDYVRSEEVLPLLDQACRVVAGPLPAWLNYEGQAELLNIIGDGITLQVIGFYDSETMRWEGFVRSASIFSELFEVGHLKTGMGLDEVLAQYPFLDNRDYLLVADSRELYVGCDSESRVHNLRVTDRRFDR